LAIVGCSRGPKIDTTSDETFKASLKAMTTGMTETEKREFQGDLTTALGPVGALSGAKSTAKGKSSGGQAGMYESLNGMTASDIRARAEENRQKRALERQR
jgi:hypothetical protein